MESAFSFFSISRAVSRFVAGMKPISLKLLMACFAISLLFNSGKIIFMRLL